MSGEPGCSQVSALPGNRHSWEGGRPAAHSLKPPPYSRLRLIRLFRSLAIANMSGNEFIEVATMRTLMQPSPDSSPALPHPGTAGYADLPQFPSKAPLPFRRTIRRHELHKIVPLAETTIYEMEQRGEFPRRFRLTARCVVWDLEEVEAWIEARKQASRAVKTNRPTGPDVKLRQYRPVR